MTLGDEFQKREKIIGVPIDLQAAVALCTFAAVLYGTSFEIGYFASFGIEFLSLAGISDWVFAAGIVGFFVVTAGIVTFSVATQIDRHLTRYLGESISLFRIVISVFGFIALIPLLLVWLLPHKFVSVTPPMRTAAIVWALCFLSLMFCLLLLRNVRNYWHYRQNHEAKLFLVVTGVLFIPFTLAGGAIYSSALAGRICIFSFKDGHSLTATYMRSVAEGYLTKLDDKRLYFPRSEVTELRCDSKQSAR